MNVVMWGFYLALIYWPIKTIAMEIRQRSLDNDFDEFDEDFPFMWEEEES